jgi:secreted trypsin-like serine protease
MLAAAPTLQLFLILIGTDSENLAKDPLDNPHCGSVPRQEPQQHQLQTRMIVGGSEARPDAWPWQVAVLNSKKQLICGGTLISNEFVLTAAHCISSKLRIVAGEYNLAEKDSEDRQERVVARVYKHPQYNRKFVDNDIALLKLDRPLILTSKVWPACLPDQDEELDADTNATILGWGATRYLRNQDGKPQVERDDMLREASVPVVDFAECKQSYGDDLKTSNVICAGYKEGQIDSCAGDSGGPLLVQKDSKWHVYGVTSFGDECGKEGKYGIYSRTSIYINWIKRVVLRATSSRVSV